MTSQTHRLDDCYVLATEDSLTIGNGLIERRWDCSGDHFRTTGLTNRMTGHEWVPADYCGPESVICHRNKSFGLAGSSTAGALELEAEVRDETALESRCLHAVVSVRIDRPVPGSTGPVAAGEDRFTIKKHFLIYPGVPVIRTCLEVGSEAPVKGLAGSTIDSIQLAPRELRATAIELHDDTDSTNYLVTRRQARVLQRMAQGFAGNMLFVEDPVSEEGVFMVKESPVHDSQLFPQTYDFRVNPLSVIGAGFDDLQPGRNRRTYGAAVGVYSGGQDEGIAALKSYQRSRYKVIPTRDFMVSSNPWEDHLQKIDEGVILQELAAASCLGLSHFQIDYGWFGRYMTDFDETKFPRQLTRIRQAADDYGIKLGLWMNPMGVWAESPVVKEHPDWVAIGADGEPVESFSFIDPVLGMDLCNDGYFGYIRDLMLRYHDQCGIVNFKLDMFQLDRYDTRFGDLYDHWEAYERLQREVRIARPDVEFIQDVTVGKRPSYDYSLEYGIIMLENRYLIPRAGRYYPHQTLGNLWQLAPFVPPQKILIETHHDAPGYSAVYSFAIAMFANPLFWEALAKIPPSETEALATLIDIYKRHRDEIFSGHILPIGEAPSGESWTGFQSICSGGGTGYVIVFREGTARASATLDLKLTLGKKVVLRSLTDSTPDIVRSAAATGVKFCLERENSFRLYRYEAKS